MSPQFLQWCYKKQSQNEQSCLKIASEREKSGFGNCIRVHWTPPLPTKPSAPSSISSCAGPRTGRDPSAAALLLLAVPEPRRVQLLCWDGLPAGRALSSACSAGKGAWTQPQQLSTESTEAKVCLGGKCQMIPYVFIMPTRFGIVQVQSSLARYATALLLFSIHYLKIICWITLPSFLRWRIPFYIVCSGMLHHPSAMYDPGKLEWKPCWRYLEVFYHCWYFSKTTF